MLALHPTCLVSITLAFTSTTAECSFSRNFCDCSPRPDREKEMHPCELPDHVVVALLKREALLARVQLHVAQIQGLESQERLITMQTKQHQVGMQWLVTSSMHKLSIQYIATYEVVGIPEKVWGEAHVCTQVSSLSCTARLP